MNIFFHASIFAKEQFEVQYSEIVRICRSAGHNIFDDHILNRSYRDTDKFDIKQHQNDFKKLTKQIRMSDVVIVEGTAPSIGTGHYMTIALFHLKPTLVLYQGNPHGVLVGDPNRLLSLKKYSLSNISDLEVKLLQFLKESKVKLLKNRFNLMLDDEMMSLLAEHALKKNTSKADVLRNLITENLS